MRVQSLALALLTTTSLLAAPIGTAARGQSRVRGGAADAKSPCCFTNPRYVGTCKVEPTGDESCASVLDYLNNPQSQGKTYCGSTSIRGDWKPTACQP